MNELGCQHCGQAHGPNLEKCPVTGFLMSSPGPIGQRIDRYQVERLLGAGGFGSVYRARHVHTDATVALKVLKKELLADQSMLDRFMREAKAANAVGSEHIVGVLDAGVADGQAFLALEFLDGWDLKELVFREGAQDPSRLIEIVLQVLDGLTAAHAKGVVHRDMKPANVFIIRRGERDFVKLLDFGISKMHQEGSTSGLTMTGVAMGTPAYMAPEQFFDARNVDGRADLYSVAVMLYELLARRLPFEATSYAELVVKVRTEIPPPLHTVAPQLPAALCAVVDKGLAREREQRWQSAQQLADALRAAVAPGVTPERLKATPVPLKLEASASLLMDKTAARAPVALTPGHVDAPPLAPSSFGPAPVKSPSAPVSFGPGQVPAGPPPPSFGAPPLAPVQATKSGRTALWVVLIIGSLFSCCALSLLFNKDCQQGFQQGYQQSQQP